MSGLIKQQILKRLSKFTKNLSADQINLSAMKGEGDLTNLELDEIILMELLGTPSWVKLTRAFCNRLTIKVQWTKLSSQPITLILDEVNIEMETCDYRDHMSENIFSSHSSGKYGYTEQIMDGMSLSINVININFRSSSFHATFQMSRVTVESRTPTWQVGSLDRTRIKNDLRGEVIIFKEVQWQAVRIEANALTDWILTTPLRLIANQSKIRITLKKRMADCGIICTKVEVNMDDVLWVLTDSQVFAAMTFVDDLRNIIVNNQSTQVSLVPKSQSCASALKSPPAPHKTLSQRQLDVERFFNKFSESSYHFFTGRIELHLCDDISQESSNYRCRIEGGAMQLVLNQLELSYYPMRHAGSTRQGWPRYNECNSSVERWTQSLLSSYLKHKDIIDWHLQRFSKGVKQEILECCMVVRLKDLCLYCVSSSNDPKKSKPRRFFGSDKKRLLLPEDMPVFHVEFTNYYRSPIPSSLHVTINPVCLSVHHPSLLWINAFVLNVVKKSVASLLKAPPIRAGCEGTVFAQPSDLIDVFAASKDAWWSQEKLPVRKLSEKQVDTRLEVLMPRITLPASETQDYGRDEDLLQIHLSKLLITNLLVDDSSHKNSTRVLASQFQTYKLSKFYHFGFQFKNASAETGGNGKKSQELSIPPLKYPHGFIDAITRTNKHLKKEGDSEMWCLVCDQFWIDFLTPNKQPSHPSGRKFKTQNFLESFPFTLWLLVSPTRELSVAKIDPPRFEQNVTCMMCIDVKVKILADCQQLNFLTRMMSFALKTYDEIALDAYRIGLSTPSLEILTTSLILLPKVELCLILPSSPMMSSSSSSSIPYASSSSSSLMSLSNRAIENQNGLKHNASISSDEITRSQTTKLMCKDDLLINGDESKQMNLLRIEPHLNHFLELNSFESVRQQTKDTMSSMFSELSTKLRGSDSHIHDHVDDEDWFVMMLNDESVIPAFERTKEIYDDNEYDDVISDSSSNKKKMISILSVGLHSFEILMEMDMNQLKMMMMIDNISTEEIEKINYEKFKSTYLLANNESIPLYPDKHDGCSSNSSFFKFHYNVARVAEMTDFKDNVQLEIQDCKLKLNSSTLLKIVKAFEGFNSVTVNGSHPEILMHVFLKSIGIDIMDKDFSHRISIDSIQISKREDGIIHVGSGGEDRNNLFKKEKEPSQDVEELKLECENETLKRQLEKLGKLTMCEGFEGDLNHWKERCRKLENEAKDMEVQARHLLAERDSLLKLVDTLQNDLEFSEKLRNRPSNS